MPLLGMSAPALRPAHIEGIGLAAPGESSRTGNCRWSGGGSAGGCVRVAICGSRFQLWGLPGIHVTKTLGPRPE